MSLYNYFKVLPAKEVNSPSRFVEAILRYFLPAFGSIQLPEGC